MKLRQGNVFTPVCQSFCSQGGHAWWGLCMARACMAGGMDGGGGHAWSGACMARGCAWQTGACVAGGIHIRWVCMVGVFMGVCMAGAHVWQERWPPLRAVRILLECILVNFALKYTHCLVLEQLMSIRRQIKDEMISYFLTFSPPLRF